MSDIAEAPRHPRLHRQDHRRQPGGAVHEGRARPAAVRLLGRSAVQILDHLGVDFVGVDVLQSDELRQGIKAFSDWPTIPQLYVKGEFVGGCGHHPRDVPGRRTEAPLVEKGVLRPSLGPPASKVRLSRRRRPIRGRHGGGGGLSETSPRAPWRPPWRFRRRLPRRPARIGHGAPDFYAFWPPPAIGTRPTIRAIIAQLEADDPPLRDLAVRLPAHSSCCSSHPFTLLSLKPGLTAVDRAQLRPCSCSPGRRCPPGLRGACWRWPRRVFFAAELGQTSLPVGAAMIGAWLCATAGRPSRACCSRRRLYQAPGDGLAPVVFWGRWRTLAGRLARAPPWSAPAWSSARRWVDGRTLWPPSSYRPRPTDRIPSALIAGPWWAALVGGLGSLCCEQERHHRPGRRVAVPDPLRPRLRPGPAGPAGRELDRPAADAMAGAWRSPVARCWRVWWRRRWRCWRWWWRWRCFSSAGGRSAIW